MIPGMPGIPSLPGIPDPVDVGEDIGRQIGSGLLPGENQDNNNSTGGGSGGSVPGFGGDDPFPYNEPEELPDPDDPAAAQPPTQGGTGGSQPEIPVPDVEIPQNIQDLMTPEIPNFEGSLPGPEMPGNGGSSGTSGQMNVQNLIIPAAAAVVAAYIATS